MSSIPHFMHVIAGLPVIEAYYTELDRRAPKGPRGRPSSLLREVQEAEAFRGLLGVELVQSIYGWSVRYDSGIQNFDLLASARQGNIDGSREAAEAFAREWMAQAPGRRYAWVRG